MTADTELALALLLFLGVSSPIPAPGSALASALPVERILAMVKPFLASNETQLYSEPPPGMEVLCSLAGRSCRTHTVRTADGYLLGLVHILGSRPGATPVLVQHGFLESSAIFLSRRDGSDLGYVLHDAGFDVWLGNFRGTTYSRRHVFLDPSSKDRQFWNFTLHETGLFDLSALIDNILARTGAARLQYIGHSMGATSLLVLLSTAPHYNERVELASLLAPVVTVNTRGSRTIRTVLKNAHFVRDFLYQNDIWEMAPRHPLVHHVGNKLCRHGSIFLPVCDLLYDETSGIGARPRIPDLFAIILAFHPAGSSTRIVEHFGAITLSRRFRPAGSGLLDKNPGPDYNLSAISAPIAIYYSKTDGLADPREVEEWSMRYPNVVRRYLIPNDIFNHLDFILAERSSEILYRPLIQHMTSFQKG